MNIGKWLFLLWKRLLKKPTFLMLLLLIPLLVLCCSLASGEKGGIVTVALCAPSEDPMAQQICRQLTNDAGLLHYISCETPEQARQLVISGKADSAWIFADDLTEKVYLFLAKPSRENAFVRIVEREETVPLLLAREKLAGTVFACTSPAFYLQYIRKHLPELREVSDEALLLHYNESGLQDSLFSFGNEGQAKESFLLTPLRGLLMTLGLLCSLASAMYYIQDTRRGVYGWIPQRFRIVAELAGQLAAVGSICLASLVALWAAGLAEDLLRELAAAGMYALCVSLFAMALRRICNSLSALAVLTPLLIMAILALCPVFLDLDFLRPYQLLLPPTYGIHGVYSLRFLLLMLPYSGICGLFCLIWDRLKPHK